MNSDMDVRQLPEGFDAYCICTGARPRVTSLSPDAN